MNVTKIAEEVARRQTKLEALRQSEAAASQRLSIIESSSNELAFAALAEDDSAARKELRNLGSEKEQIVAERRHLAAAIAGVENIIAQLQTQLAFAQKLAERDEATRLTKARPKKAERITKLLAELKQAIAEVLSGDPEIAAALRKFGGSRLDPIAKAIIENPSGYIWAFIKAGLSD